jgi:hypothetical protein
VGVCAFLAVIWGISMPEIAKTRTCAPITLQFWIGVSTFPFVIRFLLLVWCICTPSFEPGNADSTIASVPDGTTGELS